MALTDADRIQMTNMALTQHNVQLGGTIKQRTTLYNRGGKRTALTGGYTRVTQWFSGFALPAGKTGITDAADRVIINATGLKTIGWGDVLITNNAIDLTDYDRLEMEYEMLSNSYPGTPAGARICLWINDTNTVTYMGKRTVSAPYMGGGMPDPHIMSMNISEYSGPHYIYFGVSVDGATSYYVTGNIFKVALLKLA